MTDPESETTNKAGYLFAVIIAVQLIVGAFGLALDHHCRSGGGKEHCVIVAGAPSPQTAGPGAGQ